MKYLGFQKGSFKNDAGQEVNFSKLFCSEKNEHVYGEKCLILKGTPDLPELLKPIKLGQEVEVDFDQYQRVKRVTAL